MCCLPVSSYGVVSIPSDYTSDEQVNLADFSVFADGWSIYFSSDDLSRFNFHWLMNGMINQQCSVEEIYTDKSRYNPNEPSLITVICKNTSAVDYQGKVKLCITINGRIIYTAEQNIFISASEPAVKTFLWSVPSADFQGYLVEAWLDNGDFATTAIDVSSDWKRYPRYGYITEFYSSTTTSRNIEMLNELSRDYHINSLQYYDWMWRHENVIKRSYTGAVISPWLDWRNLSISFEILQDSISKALSRAMAPMPYFQIYLALDNYELVSGVSPQWGLYSDATHTNQYSHNAGVNMWLFDPNNVNWRNHLFGEYEDALTTMNWGGIHLDQLGNIGNGVYYDYWGGDVNLESAFAVMLSASREQLDLLGTTYPAVESRDAFIFNIVDGGVGNWAVDTILASDVDIVYSELWNNSSYGGVKNFVEYAKANSGNKAVVLAAYINRGQETDGYFDTDSVLLADAGFFACGAFHIELGDGEYMLSHEFFPSREKLVSDELKVRLKNYYNFITAYESLLFSPDLRNGDAGLQWLSAAGYNLSGDGAGNTIWFLNRGTEKFEIFHLINLLGNDDQWRNIANSPPVAQNIVVKLRLGPDVNVKRVYLASPDIDCGIMQPLVYTQGTDGQGDYVLLTIPSIEYWDMLYIERDFIAPVDNRYEAEKAVKWNVGVNTDHSGYSGDGFVDQFCDASDSVSFYISAAQAENYTLSFRYANGGLNAVRTLTVDGKFSGDINFNSTGSWDNWSTSDKTVNLSAGVHQVVLHYSSSGSGAINIDYLEAIRQPHLACKMALLPAACVSFHRNNFSYSCFNFLVSSQNFSFSFSKQVAG